MKNTLLFTIFVVGLTLNSCNSSSQPTWKDIKEIEKLTKEEFAEESAAIYVHVFQEMGKLLNKHSKIDERFEKEIDQLYESSVKQMIQYGKALAKKDIDIQEDYAIKSFLASWAALDKLNPTFITTTEKHLDERLLELEAYASDNLVRKFDDLSSIMDFLNFEKLKKKRPKSAEEFGVL